MSENQKIILASSSKRREQLLKQLGIKNFKIVKPKFSEENYKNDLPITKKVVQFSYLKAKSVIEKSTDKNLIIISGDTEVYRCGKTFSKTFSHKKVKEYLISLSGRKHYVLGGICVIDPKGNVFKKLVKTEVYFNKISLQELKNEPLINEGKGKAGGYAIQGYAAKFVKKIRGSYSNVVGLSISDLYLILKGIGFKN
ncbi:MAG: septum formation inhibitor Maf [Rickettsiales bacterium]|nr:septum formation inhibitor Maf [Rickettsiales bacterium]